MVPLQDAPPTKLTATTKQTEAHRGGRTGQGARRLKVATWHLQGSGLKARAAETMKPVRPKHVRGPAAVS